METTMSAVATLVQSSNTLFILMGAIMVLALVALCCACLADGAGGEGVGWLHKAPPCLLPRPGPSAADPAP